MLRWGASRCTTFVAVERALSVNSSAPAKTHDTSLARPLVAVSSSPLRLTSRIVAASSFYELELCSGNVLTDLDKTRFRLPSIRRLLVLIGSRFGDCRHSDACRN